MQNIEMDYGQYSFLKPSEELVKQCIPFTNETLEFDCENNVHNRVFFMNLEYDNLEALNIRAFKGYLEQNSVNLPE